MNRVPKPGAEVDEGSDREQQGEPSDFHDCEPCCPNRLLEENDASESKSSSETTQDEAMDTEASDQLEQADKYQKEIAELSTALINVANDDDKKSQILVSRSTAYLNFSRCLRNIPASNSERQALYAPDPLALANKALIDADAALKQLESRCFPAKKAQAEAHFLLENYAEARQAYQILLYMEPGDLDAAQRLAECQEQLTGAVQPRCCAIESSRDGMHDKLFDLPAGDAKERMLQELECTLCLKLLYEPVTTPCGHSFCQGCYTRATDHTNKCPMCRTILHVGRKLPVTIFLKNFLERMFPEEYAARIEEERLESVALLASQQRSMPLPLFIMSVILPGERMALNIFEPRYRLLVRRVMEGNRRFGMAVVDRRHQLASTATEVELVECDPLPDGRFFIEIIGKQRFKPMNPSEQDGYRVANPEYFTDQPISEYTEEAVTALEAAAAEVETMADTWVDRLRNLGQSRSAANELLRRAGNKPPRSEYETFSWWVGNLICPVVDDASMKFRLLDTRCTLTRMNMLVGFLRQVRDVQIGSGCTVM